MRITLLLFCFVLHFYSSHSQACQYPPQPSFSKSIASAKSAFVFQVVSAKIAQDSVTGEPLVNRIVATIRITQVLKGSAKFRVVAFSNSWCGGNRLEVGHYFVAVTTQSGNLLTLAPADESVLDITRFYREDDQAATNRAGVIPKIVAGLRGSQLPANFPSRQLINLTLTTPPPPPPPPPPKQP